MTVFKVLIIFVFGFIFWQDCKDRLVYWFLYPLIGVFGYFIQTKFLDFETIVANTSINLCLILTVLLVLYVYCKIILNKKLINHSIGTGDILFFVFLTCCFSIVSFLVLFAFSLFFSLVLHLIFKNKTHKTIPLAGYMSIFFVLVYCFSFIDNCNFIFAY